uniref:Uncharacterized protein n=1 Tax=Setaria viridis TaxID=4556 RepID=A0A4U6V1L7_SETVI|nr:hypothetical protein SEVIR_4G150300v2 [Setaria viridis]
MADAIHPLHRTAAPPVSPCRRPALASKCSSNGQSPSSCGWRRSSIGRPPSAPRPAAELPRAEPKLAWPAGSSLGQPPSSRDRRRSSPGRPPSSPPSPPLTETACMGANWVGWSAHHPNPHLRVYSLSRMNPIHCVLN